MGMYRFSWSAAAAAIGSVSGWRRVGREWRGPCPVLGIGTNTCWIRPADYLDDGLLVGCHKCQPFDPSSRRAHVESLVAGAVVDDPRPAFPAPAPRRLEAVDPAARVRAVWRGAQPISETPGARYLARVRRCWSLRRYPPSVRWLGVDNPLFYDVRPAPPREAAGLILYGFRGVVDRRVAALQLEPVTSSGQRLVWPVSGVHRVSLFGSLFDGGRQRFEVAAAGKPDAPVFLVEGPTSALAASSFLPELREGWSVCGLAGWAGFTAAAVGKARSAWLFPDGDPDSRRAVALLADDLRDEGLAVRVAMVPDGCDLLDLCLARHRFGFRPALGRRSSVAVSRTVARVSVPVRGPRLPVAG